jgi:hypothetical protein
LPVVTPHTCTWNLGIPLMRSMQLNFGRNYSAGIFTFVRC